jgi:hypothetical protein
VPSRPISDGIHHQGNTGINPFDTADAPGHSKDALQLWKTGKTQHLRSLENVQHCALHDAVPKWRNDEGARFLPRARDQNRSLRLELEAPLSKLALQPVDV